MAFQTWQVGLDIQNGQLCALGIQRRRNGWQLRHWWQHVLPQDTLVNGLLQRPEPVIALLQNWRRTLPYRISLRVGFPPQLVLQRQIELPGTPLREPERSRYIIAAARRFFPIEPETLALDYRIEQDANEALYLTAARKDALKSWLHCLEQARLSPEVLELSPAALHALSSSLSLNPSSALVHRLQDHWLWYSALPARPRWGWCSLQDAPDFAMLQQKQLPDFDSFYYSSFQPGALPERAQWLDPFDAFALKQPPLPMLNGAFTLAAGLALRPGDV
ncbi:pilus assembly protein PilM [Erwinia sp.]|uniref:pilus assembly protein PilM n=1 Tax=Erwinia citreus TaxID=558 RepID=UPI003C78AF37